MHQELGLAALTEKHKYFRLHDMRKHTGFTLIEVMVTIVVLIIIASIAVVSFTQTQKESRDSARKSSITNIASALENYYEKNGEYPSCATLSGDGSTVAGLLGVTADTLVAPMADDGVTNSIKCDNSSQNSSDIYVYTGDSSSQCQSGNSCQEWTLGFSSELNDEVISVASKKRLAMAEVLELEPEPEPEPSPEPEPDPTPACTIGEWTRAPSYLDDTSEVHSPGTEIPTHIDFPASYTPITSGPCATAETNPAWCPNPGTGSWGLNMACKRLYRFKLVTSNIPVSCGSFYSPPCYQAHAYYRTASPDN